MAKYIEVLRDGLTVKGRVQPSGARVQVPEDFPIMKKKDQVARWGQPRYRQITQSDFEGVGGVVVPDPPADEAPQGEEEEVAVQPFAAFEGLNVEDTLALAAELPDDQLSAFITFETEGENRKSVLEPLGVEVE